MFFKNASFEYDAVWYLSLLSHRFAYLRHMVCSGAMQGCFVLTLPSLLKKMVVFSLSLHLISRNFTLEKEHAAGWHLLAYGCISLNLITKRYEV